MSKTNIPRPISIIGLGTQAIGGWMCGSKVPGHESFTMKSIFLACFCAIMLGCAENDSLDRRNFAIDTSSPTPNEVQLAEVRATNFWKRNASHLGTETRYLAVEASKVFPPDIQGLYPKLINSETTAGFFAHGGSYSDMDFSVIMIYDTKAGHFVSNQGYVCVDTPPFGGLARFGDYTARYIGTGSWWPF